MAGLEDAVVAAAGRGDQVAVESIYRDLAPRVLGYLRARGVEDPEGLTDEVFMAVIPRLPDLRGGAGGCRTLVFSVAHARAVDDLRRRSRWPVHGSYEPELDPRLADSAETVVMGGVATERIGQLLDELGEEQRAVIMLRIVGDLSLEQTAGVLGRSVGSVKQLQRRGLLRLRELMDDEGRTP